MSASTSIQSTIMEGYFRSGPSKFFDSAGGWAENVSRILALGSYGAKLGQEISKMHGDTTNAEKLGSVSDGFGSAAGTVSVIRVILPIERLVTGKMFWERNADGTWVRTEVGSGATENNRESEFVHRHFIDIIQDIIALCARVLTPVNWLHGRNVYDLGKHAQRISDSIMALWGAFLALDIVQNIGKLCNNCNDEGARARAKKHVAEIVCDTLDLAALPFDFGYGMNSTPALAITGVVLNILSNATYLIKEMAYYA